MADNAADAFRMLNARGAVSRGLSHVEQQVLALENAVRDEPTRAFDLARTLVESTCRTILAERQVPYRNNDNLSTLLNKVSQNVPFLPPAARQETAARRSLERTLIGLRGVIQGITELRNRYGFDSHGRDSVIPQMEAVQALLAAGSADVVVGFLYGVHVQDRTAPGATHRPLYDDNEDFNNFIDENHEICTILESEFWPSEILFHMEPETYRLRLAEFTTEAGGPEEADA